MTHRGLLPFKLAIVTVPFTKSAHAYMAQVHAYRALHIDAIQSAGGVARRSYAQHRQARSRTGIAIQRSGIPRARLQDSVAS
ncbi:hypothetical protein K525DRAFT_257023 [Schizophyllum commune Loenen D]|nr:hypothetical protein K525DRAFT_257023 [Schizophyllum commune Loenen D]